MKQGMVRSEADQDSLQLRAPASRLRRIVFVVLVVLTGLFGTAVMASIVWASTVSSGVQWAIVVLFAVTFTWISVAFWTALAGFVLHMLQRDPLHLQRLRSMAAGSPDAFFNADPGARTAIVMPVFHEDMDSVSQRIEATLSSLAATGQQAQFDFFLLSDSQEPAFAEAEQIAVERLRARVPDPNALFYRRRKQNLDRKPGNIAEFCAHWGAKYRYFVVLDADSVMAGETLVELVWRMEANPQAAILQTLPLPVGQKTLFGRIQQFAHALYSPLLATGQSFWMTDTANYWGHNAILRMDPFREHGSLPVLPGSPPLGGAILSHDFVEAALLRRAGWKVWLLPHLGGSFEEMPSNLLDYARRDRRWVQGNVQHLRLLFEPGLYWMSRLHFLLGAWSYLASPAWLLLLLSASLALLLGNSAESTSPAEGFSQLSMLWLLLLTLGLLFLPRMLGVLLALWRRPARFGGKKNLLLGSGLEIIASILMAPVQMVFHTRFVVSVLAGISVSWNAQARDHREISWQEALQQGWMLSFAALVWALLLVLMGGGGWVIWMLPVFMGLLLTPWLLRMSGDTRWGMKTRSRGWFITPEEQQPGCLFKENPAVDSSCASWGKGSSVP